MKKTLCYSVCVSSIISISDKAYLVTCFDGSKDIVPKSQVFGKDHNVSSSEAYWIAAWILEKKKLQYTDKRKALFDEKRRKYNYIEYRHHKAPKMDCVISNEKDNLKR